VEAVTEEEKHSVRLVEGALVAAALAIGGIEAAGYLLQRLAIWEAVIMTPLIPILVTFALYLDYELVYHEAVWRGRRVQSEFKKLALIMLGVLTTMVGLAAIFAFVGGGLERAVIDTGAGTSLICVGIYIAKRYTW
jgi:hypothetical protein